MKKKNKKGGGICFFSQIVSLFLDFLIFYFCFLCISFLLQLLIDILLG